MLNFSFEFEFDFALVVGIIFISVHKQQHDVFSVIDFEFDKNFDEQLSCYWNLRVDCHYGD